MQTKLEWTIRKVNVTWYATQKDFEKVHRFGPQAIAATLIREGDASIHLGPQVLANNFDEVFGHELVHVIIFQKYKGAIPKWLEEGLANHLAKKDKVNYVWLAKQALPKNVLELAHPLKVDGGASAVILRYQSSQALAEMLDKKCNLERLIQLSVQKKMEAYIQTYCEIKDLNLAFKKWVFTQSRLK
jgi:hypothetical protein